LATQKELKEARKLPLDDYLKVTDQNLDNPLATLTNVVGNIFTQGGVLGAINFDNTLPMRTTGFEYFKNNKADLLTRYNNRPSLTLNLNDDTTLEDYESYEVRKANLLKFIQKLQNINKFFTGKSWRDYLSEGATFGELLNYIISNESVLDMLDLKDLVRLIYQKVVEYQDLLGNKERIEKEIYESDLGIIDALSDNQKIWYDEQLNYINKRMKTIEENSDFDLMNPVDVVKLLEERVTKTLVNMNDNRAKRLIADEFKNGAKFISSIFKNNLEYDDLNSVESELKKLFNLKRIMNLRKGLLSTPEFGNNTAADPLPDFQEELDELIEELMDIRKEVIKRINSKYRLEILSYKNFVEGLYNTLSLNIPGTDKNILSIVSDTARLRVEDAFKRFEKELNEFLEQDNLDELAVLKSSIHPETIAYALMEL